MQDLTIGVLWHGDTVISGVKKTLAQLRATGKRILFVSNNSTKSRRAYLKKFQTLDIQADVEEIFGSAYAAAYYLKNIHSFPAEKRVYVVGAAGICDELAEEGIAYCGSKDDAGVMSEEEWLAPIEPDASIGAVLVGFDLLFNYRKLCKANYYLRNNVDCPLFATNTDASYPNAGQLYPGTGCFVDAIETASGQKAKVFGKPHSTLMECILKKFHLDPKHTCMVGDRLDTDIVFGKQSGLQTLLVLTGVTQKADLQNKLAENQTPDHILECFADLFTELN